MVRLSIAAASLLVLSLSACGGGGGGPGVGSTPAPPPSPPTPPPPPSPPPGSTVNILPNPTVGQFASLGGWTNNGTWADKNGVATPPPNFRFPSIQSDPSAQPAIRYTASGSYEVRLPGGAFVPLEATTSGSFKVPPNGTFSVSGSGYQYSQLATWSRPDLDFGATTDFGIIAFGQATAAANIPVTGSASYQGIVNGFSDAQAFDGNGFVMLMPVEGSVALQFDFAGGNLTGSMNLIALEGMSYIDLGKFTFAQTVFAKGSTEYSGAFATSLAGTNFFKGRFTGPNAEETIANWVLPVQINGASHQAFGAWIAKKAN